MAGIGLAGATFLQANASGRFSRNPNKLSLDNSGGIPEDELSAGHQILVGRKVFVEKGNPIAVLGSATKDMYSKENELIIPADSSWGNPLFADTALLEKDFHIHARLTLDRFAGTGASFLIGGHYHYPCSRPEGNVTFRVSLDDNLEVYNGTALETGTRIVYGMTGQRAPWYHAKKEIAGKTDDYIRPGIPFNLDLFQTGRTCSFQVNGKEVFNINLRDEGRIFGPGDSGWPVSFGFLPDRGSIRLHDFWAEGSFTRMLLEHQDVWMMGQDGYFTYRIPSLCVTPGGSLLAFAEARRSDWLRWDWRTRNADEVHCVMKRSMDWGKTWSGQKTVLARGSSYEARDAAHIVDWQTGEVFLVTYGPYIMKMKDEGESWSEPYSLRGILGNNVDWLTPGPGSHGIQLRNGKYKGRLVVAMFSYDEIGCGVIYSDDHGKSWKLGEMTTERLVHEPHVIELEDGSILMNARQHTANNGRFIAISHDGGRSFKKEYYDEQLPSIRCQASLMRYTLPGDRTAEKGKPILFLGPGEPRSRRNLTVKVSRDECDTWPISSPIIYSGHTGYNAMAVLPDGQIGVLYEKDAYRRLSFVKFPLDWVTGQNH